MGVTQYDKAGIKPVEIAGDWLALLVTLISSNAMAQSLAPVPLVR